VPETERMTWNQMAWTREDSSQHSSIQITSTEFG